MCRQVTEPRFHVLTNDENEACTDVIGPIEWVINGPSAAAASVHADY